MTAELLSPFWTALLQSIVGLAITLTTGVIGWVGTYAVGFMRAKLTESYVGRIGDAAARAAGLAYDALSKAGAEKDLQAVENSAMALAGAYMAQGTTGKLAAKVGLSPERVAEMVRGELGKLKAADPNVRVEMPQDGLLNLLGR